MSGSEVKRVYIVRPERKSIQKHLKKELGSKRNEDTRINAQVFPIFPRRPFFALHLIYRLGARLA